MSHDITNNMADCRGPRLFLDLNNAFKRDPQIDEFDVIGVIEPRHNRSPIILQEHKLGVEAWAGKILLKYTANRLIGWRRRLPEEKFIDPIEISQLSRAVLLFNPDNYTAWNIRKELIESGTLTISEDLSFGSLVLSKHPKSPETFIHRRWLFQQLLDHCLSSSSGSNGSCTGAGAASTSNEDLALNVEAIDVDVSCSRDLDTPLIGAFTLEASRMLVSHTQRELQVSQSAAERYPCNYHAWSHRIWIIQHCLNCSLHVLQTELKVTEEWTKKHISDHSGFHYRQFLLSEMQAQKGKRIVSYSPGIADLLQKEMTYIQDLIQCFPGHEALWYHRKYVMKELLHSKLTIPGNQDCVGDIVGSETNNSNLALHIAQERERVSKKIGSTSHKYEKRLAKNYLTWLERQEQ